MLCTNHWSLTWLRNFKESQGLLAGWLERLQELDFEVVHWCGTAHHNADSLSRSPCRHNSHDFILIFTEVAAMALQLPS